MASSTDSDESRQTELIVLSWLFTGIAIIVVTLKFFTRVRIVRVTGWDDFFIFLALAFSVVASFGASYSACLGVGRHTAAVLSEPGGPQRVIEAGKYQMIAYPFNIGSFSFPNLSIAILVNNLLDPILWRTCLLFAMCILQVAFAFISVLIFFLMCRPVQKLWDSDLPGTCWSPNVMNDFSYWLSAWTAITDIVLAVIPIVAFWKLQMKFSTKLGVCIMMGLTLLSALVTIIKATYLHLLFDKTDPFWNLAPLISWGLVEQNVVIVAACIPTLRPFFHRAFTGQRGTRESQGCSAPNPINTSFFRKRSEGLPASVSEIPLGDVGKDDTESNGSHQGDAESSGHQHVIWRTVDVDMSEEPDEQQQPRERESVRDPRIVPAALLDS